MRRDACPRRRLLRNTSETERVGFDRERTERDRHRRVLKRLSDCEKVDEPWPGA